MVKKRPVEIRYLRQIREKTTATQTQLAKAMGCSRSTVSRIENMPAFDVPLRRLSDYLLCFGRHLELEIVRKPSP